jgi:hypothetical protein
MINKIITLVVFSFIFQYNSIAQCDSVFISSIEIPGDTSSNIIVSINNTSTTHYIYLNLILKDELTQQIIAESSGGYLQLYPNLINVYEVDTTFQFGLVWNQYYDLEDIPDVQNITVAFFGVCDSIPWENTTSSLEANLNQPLSIYPNPTVDYLIVNVHNNFNFNILNYLGETVLNDHTLCNKIDTRHL